MDIILKGLISGFGYSIVSVTAALYCAHFVVKRNWFCGWIAGCGIALVQLIWAFLATLTLNLSFDHLKLDNVWVPMVGAAALYLLAWRAYQSSKEPLHAPEDVPHQKLKAFAQSIPLALAYPLRTVGYIAIFFLLGLHHLAPFTTKMSASLVLSVGVGALVWWTLICSAVVGLKKRVSPRLIVMLRRLCAFGIATFATFGLILALARNFLNG